MTVYDGYRSVIATDMVKYPAEWTFKSNAVYQQILEHVTLEQGHEYLRLAMAHERWSARFREMVCETALRNDMYGKPVRADFDSLGISCSPTNMRYLWHALCIWDHVRSLRIQRPQFVEIGGGYGGLHLWLSKMGSFDYASCDLVEAKALQEQYAAIHGLKLVEPDQLLGERFLVSAYAFSEFEPPVRRFYEDGIVKTCKHGWLLWNMILVYEFTDKPLTITDEVPLTGAGNKVVTF